MERETQRTERASETDWAINPTDAIALVLLIIGAVNWGLVGLFNFNVVTTLFGNLPILERVIYIVVGIAGLWSIVELALHLHQHSFQIRRTRRVTVHH